MYFRCVCFRGELGFLNCEDICRCVVNKQFELLEFVLIPFMLTCSMMKFLSLLLLGMCPCVVSVVLWSSFVCSVRLSWYHIVDAVAVMHLLFFVLHVCMLR